jgi:hypothetical protein
VLAYTFSRRCWALSALAQGVSYKQSTQERFQNDPTLFEQHSPFTPQVRGTAISTCLAPSLDSLLFFTPIQDIAVVAVHVNTLPYHQRELALLTSELMSLDDEGKLTKEIEMGKAMIESEREIERRNKRKARGFVEGMEKEHEDEPERRVTARASTSAPIEQPSQTAAAPLHSSIPIALITSTSGTVSAISTPTLDTRSVSAPIVREERRDGTLRVQKFERRGRQLSWSALRATDEANNDFYFINKLSGEELVRLQNKRQALSSIVRHPSPPLFA